MAVFRLSCRLISAKDHILNKIPHTGQIRRGFFAFLAVIAICTAGCFFPAERVPLPPDVAKAMLRDDIAAHSRKDCNDIFAEFQRSLEQGPAVPAGARTTQNYLALSGGGIYGAFSVGVLTGWTASGERPQFDVVTGISTGALIATFAFLGPKYDARLRDYYLGEDAAKIIRPRRLSLLWSRSIGDVEPLQRAIDAALTPETMREVAVEHAKGRRLYIGTTNLDTRRLVVWDMGAIASSKRPDAAQVYRDVILASCAVPGFFPPVLFEAESNGKKYQELHVDGGSTYSVFFQPFMLGLEPGNPRGRAGSNLYVIAAGKTIDDPANVTNGPAPVALSSLRTLMFSAKRSDLFRMYTLSLVAGLNFRLASVPLNFPEMSNGMIYNPELVTRLMAAGVQVGKNPLAFNTRPEDLMLDDEVRAPQ